MPIMNRVNQTSRRVLIAVALTAAACGAFAQSAPAAAADGQWAKTHPRRDQVNDRLANQNQRIKSEVKQGDMSKAQAAKLHRQDHRIRQEERTMAGTNGGHITKTEQRALNQQENQVSREIGH
jgi:hypothetical protein